MLTVSFRVGLSSWISRVSFILQWVSDRSFDVVSDSRCMAGTCDTLKMFSFSVMQSTFRFSNVESLAVSTNSLIYNFWQLGPVDHIFVGKKGLDATSAWENHPRVNWSQVKMGPLWGISQRSVWYSLRDKGDSANSGTQTYPKRYCQQRKALSVLVCIF